MDEKKRLAQYQRINKLWIEEVPAIPLYQQIDLYGANKRLVWKARSDELIRASDMALRTGSRGHIPHSSRGEPMLRYPHARPGASPPRPRPPPPSSIPTGPDHHPDRLSCRRMVDIVSRAREPLKKKFPKGIAIVARPGAGGAAGGAPRPGPGRSPTATPSSWRRSPLLKSFHRSFNDLPYKTPDDYEAVNGSDVVSFYSLIAGEGGSPWRRPSRR